MDIVNIANKKSRCSPDDLQMAKSGFRIKKMRSKDEYGLNEIQRDDDTPMGSPFLDIWLPLRLFLAFFFPLPCGSYAVRWIPSPHDLKIERLAVFFFKYVCMTVHAMHLGDAE